MKSRWLWICVSLAGLEVVGLAIIFIRPHEPVYQGKPLSFWVDQLPSTLIATNGDVVVVYINVSRINAYWTVRTAQPDLERVRKMANEGHEAVELIGTNALPYLTERLCVKDSGPKVWFQNLLRKQRLIQIFPSVPAIYRRGQALTAILKLGDKATPLLPELLRMSDHPDPGIRATARFAFERVAPETSGKFVPLE